jgi:hypothetical protein
MSNKWFFLCDSDQHFIVQPDNDEQFSSRKNDFLSKFSHYKNLYNVNLLICPGDCTDHGADASYNFLCPTKNTNGNEFKVFVNEWMNKIEYLGYKILVSPGNHDINKFFYPKVSLLKYIRDKYNATYDWIFTKNSGCYKYVHNGFLFISMGVYPKNLKWLKQNLPSDKNIPIIFFYHYNIESDWWTEKEKNDFYQLIQNYNVKLIINGHLHETLHSVWNNIPIIICANESVLVEVDNNKIIIH